MKKKYIPIIFASLLITSCSANCPTCPESAEDIKVELKEEFVEPYSFVEGEKSYIVDTNDTPQLILSTLLRTDLLRNADFLEYSAMEDYFAVAKETGFNTIDVVVTWNEIEPKRNEYDFSSIDTYLNFAKKYDLKLNLIWYGSIVDGETHCANIPDYIRANPEVYPVLLDLFDGAYYGRFQILDWSDPDLLSRESSAVYSLFNYIYDWTLENDYQDPVVMAQIGQGVDRFYKWRISQYGVEGNDSALMTLDEAMTMTNTYLEEISKAVKYSSYRPITRAEFCEQTGVVNYVREVYDLEHIDMVATTYLHDISATRNGIRSFADEFEGMPVINAENWANDQNYRMVLANIALGAVGYTSYQLSNPVYFPENPNGALYERYNQDGATLEKKFIPVGNRPANTKSVMNALNNLYIPATKIERGNFAALGYDNRISNDETTQKVYLSNGIMLEYDKPTSSIALAMSDGDYIYAYSFADSNITFSNCSLLSVQQGSFDEFGTFNGENVTLENNITLSLKAGETYRIRTTNIGELPSASELIELGYSSTFDALRA